MTTIEVVETVEQLRQFQPEWTHFVHACPPATPFQTPEWLVGWWTHLGSGRLHVLVFRDGADTTGVLPCFLHEWEGCRQLTLIGAGISDYLDPLFEPRYTGAILEAIESHLAHEADWEICNWQDLSAGTPLQALGAVSEDTPCGHIALGDSFEQFLTERPKDLRRNLRRYKAKAELEGRLHFDVTANAEPDLITALIELHGARWREIGEVGTIEANRCAAFLRDAATALARRDMLRIFTVYFQERVAAILLALRNPTTIFAYLSAFDPKYERFGFGRELLAQALRYAHAQRYRGWSFLRGEEAYKYSWGAERIPKCRVIITRPDGEPQ